MFSFIIHASRKPYTIMKGLMSLSHVGNTYNFVFLEMEVWLINGDLRGPALYVDSRFQAV